MVEVTFQKEAASIGISGSEPPACGKAEYIFLLSLLLPKDVHISGLAVAAQMETNPQNTAPTWMPA